MYFINNKENGLGIHSLKKSKLYICHNLFHIKQFIHENKFPCLSGAQPVTYL